MGNSLSSPDPLNQEGIAQFHAHSRSFGTVIQEQNQVTIFPPYSENKIASFSRQLSKATRARCFALQLKVCFAADSVPVLGFALTLGDCNSMTLSGNSNLSLWDLKNGRVILHGGGGVIQQLPKCVDGAIIKCVLDMGTGDVVFSVFNPGKEPEVRKEAIPNMPTEVWPFAGIASNSHSQVSFHIMHFERGIESLNDISAQVFFDARNVCGILRVSANGKVLSRDSTEQGNGCAFINKVITSGLHRWTLKISSDFGASLCLGLAKYPFNLSDDYLRDPTIHVYHHTGLWLWRSYRGLLYEDGKQLQVSLEALGWQANSSVTVELVLNMQDRTLKIFRLGKYLGIAFRDLPDAVQPVVAVYAAYEKRVELIQYFTSEPGTPALLARAVPDTAVTIVSNVTETSRLPMKVTFDPSTKSGSVNVSSDLMTLYRDKSQSRNSYCMLSVSCVSGRYDFSFIIESDQGASTCIGLAHEAGLALPKQGNIYLSPNLYLYRSFQGMLYKKGEELPQKYDEFWMAGTLVGLRVDVDEGEAVVTYAVNGKEQGTAFSGIRAPVRPIVCYYAGMEKRVTLIHFEHKPLSTPLGKPQPVQMRSIDASQPKLNSFDTLSTSTTAQNLLPIVARCSDANQYYSACMVCNSENRVIAYPCKHTPLCAEHILDMKTCIICDQPVTGVWNILKK